MKKVVKVWLNLAERDLQDAIVLFRNKSYKNSILHCHQAIEKLLKAIIIQKGYRSIRTHDLVTLVNETRAVLPKEIIDFIDKLNPHYLPTKYPDITFKFKYNKIKAWKILHKTKEVFKWLRLELIRKS